MNQRVYLDWNATAPLRPEAREAMLIAMDVVGNPSSVHAEGRAAKAIVEKARGQVATLVGCEPSEVVFTSGATEAAATVFNRWTDPDRYGLGVSFELEVEHDCVYRAGRGIEFWMFVSVDGSGKLQSSDLENGVWYDQNFEKRRKRYCVSPANSETGVITELNDVASAARARGAEFLTDAVQALGKIGFSFRKSGCDFAIASGHKIGGPKGTGAVIERADHDFVVRLENAPLIEGGGQEQGRRSGTENVIGIAGFGAAAEAARRDLESGVWGRVAKLRDDLEDRLASETPDLIIFGREAPRLPNTSCFAVPGWKGETQVMQMDLAGYAISAGSACSSGKVNKASRVLLAMGFDEETASSAIRVSMGPTTTEAEVLGFADTWIEHYRRRRERAA